VSYRQARLRRLNAHPTRAAGDYVLYWTQACRRLSHNHALDYAVRCADELGKPLVVYEGLRLDYPWASARFHRFVLEGMRDNAREAERLGINYWPFVETPGAPARGLLTRIAARAALVVTDDFPCFVGPEQSEALARRASVPVWAVDSNGVVPMSLLQPAVSAAAHLRPRIHKAFAEAWVHRAAARPRFSDTATKRVDAPFDLWRVPDDLDAFVGSLPVDQAVAPVAETRGGVKAARGRLKSFIKDRLAGYAESRSEPSAPDAGHASGLSPYLHFGHVSIEQVAADVLATTGAWSPDALRIDARGQREGFFTEDPDVNAFLDEALTWRDVGFQWHWTRRKDTRSLDTALPPWALATLRAHQKDPRPFVYSREEWEAAETHDPLWNAAQRELAATGVIHNYLRMLWGKKVIEWSRTPDEAYRTLEHLNNRYALDGRDPNSYTGILWCFGLFDRPWAPERQVLGTVRYMSSDNTARKFRVKPYLAYVDSLGR
jgi:deoxyribodipyrimidine photo-lyase